MTTNSTQKIPDWLKSTEDYTPKKDREAFLDKSTKQITRLLARFSRGQGSAGVKMTGSVALRVAITLILILLTALSRNFAFTAICFTAVLLLLALQSAERIRGVLGYLIPAECLSVLILLPAAILGSPAILTRICAKVFISVTLLALCNLDAGLPGILTALKFFRLPDILLLTLDLTVRYIGLLGILAVELLSALKVRSIGRNPRKRRALGGMIGVLFLRSVDLSKETEQAMECRGFSGRYTLKKRAKLTRADLPPILLLVLASAAYVYFEFFA